MAKRIFALLCSITVLCVILVGCGKTASDHAAPVDSAAQTENQMQNAPSQDKVETSAPETETKPEAEPEQVPECPLPDGIYSADFDTDSSMFHVNEANNGKGVLTVKDGKMTIHVSLPSKNTVNLFFGVVEDAEKEGAELLQPTIDTVTYSDGTSEEVHGFDVPVPYLDEEFDCALVGTKGKWYDHKVSVSNPEPYVEPTNEAIASDITTEGKTVEVTLSGGSGRASVQSPAVTMNEDGVDYAIVVWSSKNYEYMLVNDIQYDPINEAGENSTFKIPITFDEEMAVSALTVAMSEPHLIDYTLYFDSTTMQ